MRWRIIVLGIYFGAIGGSFGADSMDLTPVKKWIEGQGKVQSLTADFVQTRALKTLRDPLANSGKLWFRAPNFFRWQVGESAKNILLRNYNTVFLIQPQKKKATRFSMAVESGDLQKEAGRKGLMMMQFPMAKNLADFQRQFEVLSVETADGNCDLALLPKDAQAQKFLEAIKLRFDISTGELRFFEMVTRSGSTLRNQFSNIRVNEKIPTEVFDFDLTGYEVIDAKE